MSRKVWKQTKNQLLCGLLLLCPAMAMAQTPIQCTIQGNDIGTVINNPKADITIVNEYYFPIESSEKQLEEAISYLSTNELLSKKQQQLLNRQKKLDEENKSLADKAKRFSSKIESLQRQVQEVESIIEQLEQENRPDRSNKLQVAKNRLASAKSILSASNCMVEDHELFVETSDSGKDRFGFLKQAILEDPNYFLVDDFYHGLALVKGYNNVYGYMNAKMETVEEFQYDFATSFEAGFAIVRKFGQMYTLDQNFVRTPIDLKDFEELASVENCYFAVTYDKRVKEKQYCLYKIGRQKATYLFSEEEIDLSIGVRGLARVSNKTKEFLIFLPDVSITIPPVTASTSTAAQGHINKRAIISNYYTSISNFKHQSMALANEKYLLGPNGKVLEDLSILGKPGRQHPIVKKYRDVSRGPIRIGNQLVNDRFIEVSLPVTPTESQYKSKSPFIISYLYDVKNKLKRITPDYIYDRKGAEFNDWGHLWFKGIDGEYGMLDMNGEIIIDNKFSGKPKRVDSFYIVSNYYGFKGIFDHTGKQTTTIKYGEIGPLKGGFFKFSHADGKGYGVVNSNNAEIIPPICQDVQLKSDGRFHCKIDNEHFYIDKFGKCLTTNHKVYKEHLRAYRNRNRPR